MGKESERNFASDIEDRRVVRRRGRSFVGDGESEGRKRSSGVSVQDEGGESGKGRKKRGGKRSVGGSEVESTGLEEEKVETEVKTDLLKRGKRRVSDLDVEEGEKIVEGRQQSKRRVSDLDVRETMKLNEVMKTGNGTRRVSEVGKSEDEKKRRRKRCVATREMTNSELGCANLEEVDNKVEKEKVVDRTVDEKI